MIIATHLLLEFFNCRAPIHDMENIRNILLAGTEHAKLTPLHEYFHAFDPPGVTGFVALKESHISIHTWPAQAYAVVDFLTCGDREKGLGACRYLEKFLKPESTKTTETHCINFTSKEKAVRSP